MLTTQELCSNETRRSKLILIVEDNADIGLFLLKAVFQETSHRAVCIQTSQRALEVVHHIKPNLFLLDYYLDQMNGLQLYDCLHAQKDLEAIPAILLTVNLEKHQKEIEQRQLVGLAKPVDLDELLLSIEQA